MSPFLLFMKTFLTNHSLELASYMLFKWHDMDGKMIHICEDGIERRPYAKINS